jgi:hypothetical protein
MKFLYMALLFLSLFSTNIYAQENYQIPKEALENIPPEYREQMKKMMSDPDLMDSDEDFMKYMMNMSENIGPVCANKETILREAKDDLAQDLSDRNDAEYWFLSTKQSTMRNNLTQNEYNSTFRDCMKAVLGDLADLVCKKQLFNYFIVTGFKNTDFNQYKGQSERLGSDYQAKCADNDERIYKSLKIWNPKKGDSLLVTSQGSFLIAQRNGLVLGRFIPEMTSNNSAYFKNVK